MAQEADTYGNGTKWYYILRAPAGAYGFVPRNPSTAGKTAMLKHIDVIVAVAADPIPRLSDHRQRIEPAETSR